MRNDENLKLLQNPLYDYYLTLGYQTIIDYNLDKLISKTFLGDNRNKQCRFCNQTKDDGATFKKDAHVIPESTGNRYLLSHYECDNCNEKFGQGIEKDFSNYVGKINRALYQVKGKGNKLPVYKKSDTRFEVDLPQDNIHDALINIQQHEFSSLSNYEEETGIITIKEIKDPYTPSAIYKCLAKMAITLMPETELVNFKETINWVNETDHKKSHLSLLMGYGCSRMWNDNIRVLLFKRKEEKDDLFYMLFVLIFGSFFYQIYIPLSSEDNLKIGKCYDFGYYPTLFSPDFDSQDKVHKPLNMSSNEEIRNEEGFIYLKASQPPVKTYHPPALKENNPRIIEKSEW